MSIIKIIHEISNSITNFNDIDFLIIIDNYDNPNYKFSCKFKNDQNKIYITFIRRDSRYSKAVEYSCNHRYPKSLFTSANFISVLNEVKSAISYDYIPDLKPLHSTG